MSETRIVKVEVAEVPASRRDIKSSTGKVRKILPGASVGLAPVLSQTMGTIITGTEKKEFEKLYPNEDYDVFFKNFHVRMSSEGRILNLDEPLHKLIYNLLKVHPYVCTDLKLFNPLVHIFILTDEEEKAEIKVSAAEKLMKAFATLENMDIKKQRNFLHLYGIDSKTLSDTAVKAKLIEKAQIEPDKFNKFYNDNNREERILLRKLYHKGIIRKNSSSYFYGDEENAILLGANEELAVEYLKDVKNQEILIALTQLLKELE